ncbi:MAG: metallophosphoesterase family protein [Anaerolineales bacterium]
MSDRVVPFIHSNQVAETLADVDLVLGCGDLPADYLEYVLTVLNVPLAYVPGNHDADSLKVPGGTNMDGRLAKLKGVRILGLGGSIRYKPEGRNQYSETEMTARVMRKLIALTPFILLGRSAFDILLTHSPPRGIHDAQDQAHRGFLGFRRLLSWAKPTLMVHGHTHAVTNLETTETAFGRTRILNVFPYRLIDWEPGQGSDA